MENNDWQGYPGFLSRIPESALKAVGVLLFLGLMYVWGSAMAEVLSIQARGWITGVSIACLVATVGIIVTIRKVGITR